MLLNNFYIDVFLQIIFQYGHEKKILTFLYITMPDCLCIISREKKDSLRQLGIRKLGDNKFCFSNVDCANEFIYKSQYYEWDTTKNNYVLNEDKTQQYEKDMAQYKKDLESYNKVKKKYEAQEIKIQQKITALEKKITEQCQSPKHSSVFCNCGFVDCSNLALVLGRVEMFNLSKDPYCGADEARCLRRVCNSLRKKELPEYKKKLQRFKMSAALCAKRGKKLANLTETYERNKERLGDSPIEPAEKSGIYDFDSISRK